MPKGFDVALIHLKMHKATFHTLIGYIMHCKEAFPFFLGFATILIFQKTF